MTQSMNRNHSTNSNQQLAAAALERRAGRLAPAVLSDVERELRAARWDRRLARAAVVLLVVGVGLNACHVLSPTQVDAAPHRQIARADSSQALIETAIVVAEATNAETGRLFARQWAA